MVNERPKQFGGVNRFGGISRPSIGRPPSSATASAASLSQSRAQQLDLGLGKGSGGLGKSKGKGLKRHLFVSKT
jgi:histone H4